jgi:hypothetical protein
MSATGPGTKDPRCTKHPEVALMVHPRRVLGVLEVPGDGQSTRSRTGLFRFLRSDLIAL